MPGGGESFCLEWIRCLPGAGGGGVSLSGVDGGACLGAQRVSLFEVDRDSCLGRGSVCLEWMRVLAGGVV